MALSANERSGINNESPPQWVVTIEPVSRLIVKFELKYNNDEDSKQEGLPELTEPGQGRCLVKAGSQFVSDVWEEDYASF